MISLTKHLQATIEAGKRIIQVIRFGKSDVQTAFESAPFGFDSQAPKDLRAIYARSSNKTEKVVLGYINKNQLAEIGESRIFSIDSDGQVVMSLLLKNDGTAEFGGDSDFMVRFNELKDGFDELKGDVNAFVIDYNAHTHITTATVGPSAVPGIIAPTTSLADPSIADISGAKISEIKTSSI